VRLDAAPGDVVAVVGPNGSGKTTLLRAIAGLVPLTEGGVRVGDETWEVAGTPGGQRLRVPERRVGMVFQQLLLFPHLDARHNVAYGLRMRGVPRRLARDRAQEWLDRVGVGELGERRPGQLSGGQAQRVAIARALAPDPRLLLLDEPLAALDVGVAMQLRVELAHHLAAYAGTTLLVTHDALDALTVANRVVVLDDGTVVQEGTPAEVARRPRSAHVARLVGLNVWVGNAVGDEVRLQDGSVLVSTVPTTGPVHVSFPPSAVTLSLPDPDPRVGSRDSSARNRWRGRVLSLAPQGLVVRVHVDVAGGLLADVTAESAGRLGLVPGREVVASVKATEVSVYAGGGSGRAPGEGRRRAPPLG